MESKYTNQITNYSRKSGKKTLALVLVLICLIIFLSIYSVFLIFRRSSVITQSTYYEKPTSTNKPTPTPQPFPSHLQRSGD